MADKSDDGKAGTKLVEREATTEVAGERSVFLDGGRSVAVVEQSGQQVVEIRAASGQVELRVRITADGPVLSLEGVKVELSAAESVNIKTKEFVVEAQSASVTSASELKLKSEGELSVESNADVRVVGQKIWLN